MSFLGGGGVKEGGVAVVCMNSGVHRSLREL